MVHRPHIRLVVGDRWKEEAERLLRGESAAILRGDFDLSVLRAPIDLVLDNANVTSSLPDEPVIPFVSRLALALSALVRGASTKALVEFEEAPWELALQRVGPDDVLLSLYELAPPGRFSVELVSLSLDQLRVAVDRAAEEMGEAAGTLPETTGGSAVRAAIRACRDTGGPPVPRWLAVPVGPPDLTIETLSSERLVLMTHIRTSGQPLLTYRGEHPFDRHALLAPGTLMVTPDAGRSLQLPVRPLLALDEALESFRDVFRRWSDGASEHRLVTAGDGDLACRTDGTTVVLLHQRGGVVDWSVDLEAETFFALLLDHVRDVAAACVELNPRLAGNAHLTELRDSAELMRHRLVHATRHPEARRHLRVSPVGVDVEFSEPARFDPFCFPARSIRRMRYERAWTHALPGVTPRTLRFAGRSQWLVGHDRGVELIDAAEGRPLWHHGHGARGLEWEVLGDRAFFVDARGAATARDMGSGDVLWSAQLGAAAGPFVRAATGAGEAVVVALSDGNIAAVTAVAGDPLWRVGAGAEAAAALCVAGSVVVASTHGGVLTALDASSGEVVWVRRVAFERVRLVSTGLAVIVLADNPLERSAMLGALDPASGDWRDQTRVSADILAFAELDGRVAVLLAESSEHRVVIWSGEATSSEASSDRFHGASSAWGAGCVIDAEGVVTLVGGRMCGYRGGDLAWALRLAPVMGQVRLATHNAAPGIVAVAAEDEIAVVEVGQGRVLHRLPAFWEQLAFLGLDERGHLLALELPADREPRLHGVAAVGVIAAIEGGAGAA